MRRDHALPTKPRSANLREQARSQISLPDGNILGARTLNALVWSAILGARSLNAPVQSAILEQDREGGGGALPHSIASSTSLLSYSSWRTYAHFLEDDLVDAFQVSCG
jgi:hypothetical protein